MILTDIGSPKLGGLCLEPVVDLLHELKLRIPIVTFTGGKYRKFTFDYPILEHLGKPMRFEELADRLVGIIKNLPD